ncbi:hypothetical protein AAG570_005952 [Ranatra chinensis]|uniref:Uncharacterized protein n=1 Tax=Ranatra chinensis TaxID=642074 RepID=A0ABD0XXQ5_9HEMI
MVENPSKGKQKKAAGGRGGGGRRSGGDAASEPAGTQPSTGTRSAGAPPVSDSSDEDEEWTEEEGAIRIGGVVVPPAPPPHCSQEASGPRPIITHIVNENFKSYAGRVILGPFHKVKTSSSVALERLSILDFLAEPHSSILLRVMLEIVSLLSALKRTDPTENLDR